MDMMEMRFRMMAAMGGSGMIGKLSKYHKVTVTRTSDTNDNAWWNVCSVPFEPKLVIFDGGEDAGGHIINGVFSLIKSDTSNVTNSFVGCVGYRNLANGNYSGGGMQGYNDGTYHTSSAAKFQYYDGHFYVTRNGTNGWWRPDTFTFEFYG